MSQAERSKEIARSLGLRALNANVNRRNWIAQSRAKLRIIAELSWASLSQRSGALARPVRPRALHLRAQLRRRARTRSEAGVAAAADPTERAVCKSISGCKSCGPFRSRADRTATQQWQRRTSLATNMMIIVQCAIATVCYRCKYDCHHNHHSGRCCAILSASRTFASQRPKWLRDDGLRLA